LEDTEVHCF
jgi:hypothetical protein